MFMNDENKRHGRAIKHVDIGFPVVRTDGRTVTWLPNFLEWVDYHISLPMGLRPRSRASRAGGAPLSTLFYCNHVQVV